jgi:hypothetical protein
MSFPYVLDLSFGSEHGSVDGHCNVATKLSSSNSPSGGDSPSDSEDSGITITIPPYNEGNFVTYIRYGGEGYAPNESVEYKASSPDDVFSFVVDTQANNVKLSVLSEGSSTPEEMNPISSSSSEEGTAFNFSIICNVSKTVTVILS